MALRWLGDVNVFSAVRCNNGVDADIMKHLQLCRDSITSLQSAQCTALTSSNSQSQNSESNVLKLNTCRWGWKLSLSLKLFRFWSCHICWNVCKFIDCLCKYLPLDWSFCALLQFQQDIAGDPRVAADWPGMGAKFARWSSKTIFAIKWRKYANEFLSVVQCP